MTKNAKCSIFIVILSIVIIGIIGCSTAAEKNMPDTETGESESSQYVEPTATPSPTPTPVIDMPEDTYDIDLMPLFCTGVPTPEPVDDEILAEDEGESDTEGDSEDADAQEETDEDSDDEDEESSEEPEKVIFASPESESIAYCYEEIDTHTLGLTVFNNVDMEKYATYRITLKSGLKFKDGSDVTAEDVIFSIKKLSEGDYHGDYSLSDLDILGMREFNTQVPRQDREMVERILDAGINEDGTYPELEGIDPALSEAVWSGLDEAGTRFAQQIIEYVNSYYALNAYVNAFMSGYLTYAKVQADENLRTAFAYIMWGYGKGKNPYNYRKNTLTTVSGKVHELDVVSLGAIDLWQEIYEYEGNNFTDTGIDYDKIPSGKSIRDFIAEVYYEKQGYVIDDIEGIFKGNVVDGKGIDRRECIYLVINKKEDITDFNFYLTNPREYQITGALNEPEFIEEFTSEDEEGEGEEDAS